MLYYYKDIYLYYLLLNQLDLKTLVLVQLNQTFSKNLTITTKFFYGDFILLIAQLNYFHIKQKMLKMEKII